jgi:CBS-domain-containing membrane protein
MPGLPAIPRSSTSPALDLMAQRQIRRIPVVDDTRRLLGIIATHLDAPRRTAAVVEEISQPSTE